MGKIICSRDGKIEANIYYLHEVKKVKGAVYNPSKSKGQVSVRVQLPGRAAGLEALVYIWIRPYTPNEQHVACQNCCSNKRCNAKV
jgi:hypothetical protein